MRFDLKVPFAEKDQAKKLGARWDAGRKRWFVIDPPDASAFARWQPTPHEASASEASAFASSPPQRRAPARADQDEGRMRVGSRYVERPQVCACLPWDDCDQCRLETWPA